MSKHTQGPWIQAIHSPTDVIANGETMIAMTREGLNGISREQAIANARLIAAAPDLLELVCRLASPDQGELLTLADYHQIAQAQIRRLSLDA
ncbi:hypothetical protein [Limnobacter sp.]|uniref:hypothetical protein n=1 Tax=Limnobacter sp. TaxID=2003368 RepID=UPI002733BA31|nr:hypothetical protein [Limnobacter sp.]MDP3273417.1 hypothetical protein [Limnobacter sp.]